jgi:outer membrane protein OmpA-like peptidoglycan-associated protein
MVIAFVSGCAKKSYVRNQVKASSDQLAAKHDADVKQVNSSIAEVSDRLGETTKATKENTTQIAANEKAMKDTAAQLQAAEKSDMQAEDAKVAGAMAAADSAKAANGETGKRVDGLATQLANRNNYSVTAEDSVRFAFNSAKLQPEFQPVLDGIAQKLKQDPDAVIVLEGRTDNTGDAEYNIRLGQQRLDAVLRYLVVQSDVPVQRVYQLSLGEDKPVADNKTKDGREQNRATTIRVLSSHTSGTVASK